MAETVICPVCQRPVYDNTDAHSCEYCHSTFTNLNNNAILIGTVGSIPRKSLIVLSD